jgi:hypothetical protein
MIGFMRQILIISFMLMIFLIPSSTKAAFSPDLDTDYDAVDFFALKANIYRPYSPLFDLNQDAVLNIFDVNFLISRFGYYPTKTVFTVDVYGHASNMTNPEQSAQAYQAMILSRNRIFSDGLPAKEYGYTGPIMQYLIADALVGPPNLLQPTTPCTTTQQNFPVYSNNVTLETGAFCQIHDSIVLGTRFDHDLNPQTPTITAQESWFLHLPNGNRFGRSGGGVGAYEYFPNPGHPDLQAYFAARALREIAYNPAYPNYQITQADGIFLDNISYGWGNVSTYTSSVLEYSSATTYTNAVVSFTQAVHQLLQSSNQKYPVWANLLGTDQPADWDVFDPYLEGAMKEDFFFDWGRGPYSSSKIETQLLQASRWISRNNAYIAVSQAECRSGYTCQNLNRQSMLQLSLAAYLLVIDQEPSYYYYNNYNNSYDYFYYFPEYDYRYGYPLEPMQRLSTSPLIYQRNFSCSQITLNLSSMTSSITHLCPH